MILFFQSSYTTRQGICILLEHCFLVYALECMHSSRSMLLVVNDQKHTPSENMHYIAMQCNAYF